MIVLEQVEVRRGTACIIPDLTLSLTPGLVHVVIGPNGTGKTTLIRALFGDLPISRGCIRIGDQALRPNSRLGRGQAWRSHFAYMPQDTHLDIALTALEVVVVGRLGRLGLHIDDETLELATQRLDAAGVLHLADRDIGTLSGGQRQMVLFAQVMMREPRVMLLDEPVSALDLRHQIRLLDLVRLETRKRNLATVVVLHDLNLACQYADRLIVMRPGASAIMGAPTDLISAALIADTYGASVEILRDGRGNPVVQPLGSLVDGSLVDGSPTVAPPPPRTRRSRFRFGSLMMRYFFALALLLPVALFGALAESRPALADGDPAKGAKVFNKCAICHSAGAADGAKVGLDLAGVFGRPVASAPNFDFSAALRAYGADGKTWDEPLLARFLADPGGVVPGTNMAFVGLKREDEIRHLIAFLKSLPPAAPGP